MPFRAAPVPPASPMTIGPGPDCAIFLPGASLSCRPAATDKGTGDVATVATRVPARSGALDPKSGRFYLPTAQAKPVPDTGEPRTLIPGTFAVLVLAPN
jgi:hypothetical protein